jgi:hypothetical protein
MHTKKTYISVLTITLILLACVCYGKGPDDGMSISGESLYERDKVDPDINIQYIIMKAKAQSRQKGMPDGATVSSDQDGNINSVIVDPGANISGDIIIIDQSKGNKTNVVGR